MERRGIAVRRLTRAPEPSAARPSTAWEARAIEAVGEVIEFWGFKRNQGRVWALLFLRDQPRSAAEIQRTLRLSKGAVSMITRELERWRVIRREPSPGGDASRFSAERDLVAMIGRVLSEREAGLVARVRAELVGAEATARRDPGATPAQVARVGRMRLIAELVDRSLSLFLKTARLDATGIVGVLGALPQGRKR